MAGGRFGGGAGAAACFDAGAMVLLCMAAAPPVTVVSPCRGNLGKDRGAVTALDLEKLRVLRLVYLTLAHVDGRGLNPMVNQRSANGAATAVKAMPTVTETAAANG